MLLLQPHFMYPVIFNEWNEIFQNNFDFRGFFSILLVKYFSVKKEELPGGFL